MIPRLSFEQLTDGSDLILSGTITNTWAAWDAEHKYIWTHYNLAVDSVVKGSAGSSVEFAEPGGAVGNRVISIAGSVTYAVGDNMVVFLARMPNGYLRTAGWAQGKYSLDKNNRLHGAASLSSEPNSAVKTLDGVTLGELRQRVAVRNQGSVR